MGISCTHVASFIVHNSLNCVCHGLALEGYFIMHWGSCCNKKVSVTSPPKMSECIKWQAILKTLTENKPNDLLLKKPTTDHPTALWRESNLIN